MKAASSSRNSSPGSTPSTKLTRDTRTLWMVRTSAASWCTSTEIAADVRRRRRAKGYERPAASGQEKEGRSSNAERDPGSHGDRHDQRRQAGGTAGTPSREPARQE